MILTRRSSALGLMAASLTPAFGAAASDPKETVGQGRALWPNAARAAVSLSYDDGLDSQLDNAAAQIEQSGFKATFFLTQDNMETREDDWIKFAQSGHEMGNHTITHNCDLRVYHPSTFANRELLPMEAYLDEHFGRRRSRLYAYPCSVTNLGAGGPNAQRRHYDAQLKRAGLRAARTSEGPPNTLAHVRSRPYDLRACAPTYDEDDPRFAMAYVQAAIRNGAWAILVFHDVKKQRGGMGDTSMATHQIILDWLASQPIWCAPIGQVLDHIGAADAAVAG